MEIGCHPLGRVRSRTPNQRAPVAGWPKIRSPGLQRASSVRVQPASSVGVGMYQPSTVGAGFDPAPPYLHTRHHNPSSAMPRGYRHLGETPCLYFITTSIVHWIPLFISGRYCQIIIDALNYCRNTKGLRVHAYVIMPTHLHLILSAEPALALPGIVRDLKRWTSRVMTQCLEEDHAQLPLRLLHSTASKAKGNSDYKVWQDGYHPVAITTQSFLMQKLNYLHQNPVRKGLVRRAEDWAYSSADDYISGRCGLMEIDRLIVV